MIVLQDVVLQRGTKVLLDKASVSINPGERVGLVGRNGCGKSSLFSLLQNRLHEDAGDVSLPPHWRMAEVAQNMPETTDSATEFVLGGDSRLQEAQVPFLPAGRRRRFRSAGLANAPAQCSGWKLPTAAALARAEVSRWPCVGSVQWPWYGIACSSASGSGFSCT